MSGTIAENSSQVTAPRALVTGLGLLRIAAIWLLPLMFALLIVALVLIVVLDAGFGAPVWENPIVGGVTLALLSCAMLCGVATIIVASVGVFLVTSNAVCGEERIPVFSARAGARLWLTAAVFLGAALMSTDWCTPETGSLIEEELYGAIFASAGLLAVCISIHLDRVAISLGVAAPRRSGTFRVFTPGLGGAVIAGCFFVGTVLRLMSRGEEPTDDLAPALLEGLGMIVTIVCLIGATNDADTLLRRLRPHRAPIDHSVRVTH